jgi:hypothetical protein
MHRAHVRLGRDLAVVVAVASSRSGSRGPVPASSVIR